MTLKDRYFHILGWFRENRQDAATELQFDGTPFQLLVAVMLSAQCTDRRVNQVTPALFAAFPTPQKLAAASFDEVYPFVKSVSYPNSKASHLIAAAQRICAEFGGEVPRSVEQLIAFPGSAARRPTSWPQSFSTSRSSRWTPMSSGCRGASDSPGAGRWRRSSGTLSAIFRSRTAPSRTTGSSSTAATSARHVAPAAASARSAPGARTSPSGKNSVAIFIDYCYFCKICFA